MKKLIFTIIFAIGLLVVAILINVKFHIYERVVLGYDPEMLYYDTVEPEPGDILIRGNANHSYIEIYASKVNGKWQFPLKRYERQFVDVNLHNERFIELGEEVYTSAWRPWLLDENEAIWLTPMIQNNSGELINAIYSKEISSCNPSEIKILGKTYKMEELKHDSSFNNDDKWKILLDKEGSCLQRLIINMNGYFYNIKEGEQIRLFRNDNTIVLSFNELKGEPNIKIISSKPIETETKPNIGIRITATKTAPNITNEKERNGSSNIYRIGDLVIEDYIVGDLSSEEPNKDGRAVFCKKGSKCGVSGFVLKEGETTRINNTCLTLQDVNGYAFHNGWINASVSRCDDLKN